MILCSGKIALDIDAKLEGANLSERVKVIRVEELAPFPIKDIKAHIESTGAEEVFWVQEEPCN